MKRMSEYRYRVSGPVAEEPELPEEVAVGEQSPNQPNNENIPTPEEKESVLDGFQKRYEALCLENREIAHEISKAITLGSLMKDGVQALISQYGTEKFFDAVRKVKKDSKVDVPTTLHVIQALEPDYTKRQELYDTMLDDAEREQLEYNNRENAINSKTSGVDARATPDYATPDSHGTMFRVMAYRSLDHDKDSRFSGLLGYLLKNTESKDFLENGTSRAMQNLVNLPDEDLSSLKSKLSVFEDSKNNMFFLVRDMEFLTDEQTASFRKKIIELKKEIDIEIAGIIEMENTSFEKIRATILSDIKSVNLEFVTPEMTKAIQGVLSNIEALISSQVEKTENLIATRTAPLYDLLSRLDDRGLML